MIKREWGKEDKNKGEIRGGNDNQHIFTECLVIYKGAAGFALLLDFRR